MNSKWPSHLLLVLLASSSLASVGPPSALAKPCVSLGDGSASDLLLASAADGDSQSGEQQRVDELLRRRMYRAALTVGRKAFGAFSDETPSRVISSLLEDLNRSGAQLFRKTYSEIQAPYNEGGTLIRLLDDKDIVDLAQQEFWFRGGRRTYPGEARKGHALPLFIRPIRRVSNGVIVRAERRSGWVEFLFAGANSLHPSYTYRYIAKYEGLTAVPGANGFDEEIMKFTSLGTW